jgi:hypothetical protein
MASAQAHNPNPNHINAQHGLELSYWHEKMAEREAIDTGCRVVKNFRSLAVQQYAEGGPVDKLWMVTLPDDEIKTAVCEQIGFDDTGDPQIYTIGDGVTEVRQLWVISC